MILLLLGIVQWGPNGRFVPRDVLLEPPGKNLRDMVPSKNVCRHREYLRKLRNCHEHNRLISSLIWSCSSNARCMVSRNTKNSITKALAF